MCTSITIVDEASCRLPIIFGDGLTCKVLGDEFFSQRTDPTLLQEIFQTPFSRLIIKKQIKKKKKKKLLLASGTPETHDTQTGK